MAVAFTTATTTWWVIRQSTGKSESLTSARASLESHVMAFAAEQSRVEGTVVDIAAYRRQAEGVA